MSVTLKGSSVKLNTNGTIAEPSFLKGDDAKTIYSYAQDGGYTGTQANFIAKLNTPTSPYPVGSVFITASSTSPASTYGGTWEKVTDKFLLCAGTTYTGPTSITSKVTGGAATHTLTTSEMPSHSHVIPLSSSSSVTTDGWCMGICRCSWSYSSYGSNYAGGGQAHNNMPPYLAVYMWKRIA